MSAFDAALGNARDLAFPGASWPEMQQVCERVLILRDRL